MLTEQGHDVTLYSGERNDARCKEHVPVFTAADRQRWFGEETWRDRVFDRWDVNDICWGQSNQQLIEAIRERIAPGDLIACTIGTVQQPVADAFGNICFESGIGYEGSWAPFRVFESYSWMHHSYGRQGINDGRFYDTVIPNAFDPDDFVYRDDHDGYVVFLGRHTARKGLPIVAEIAKRYDVVTAGQGDERVPDTTYVGVVRGQERAKLIAGARCVLVPTQYIEPFGGVAVEAMLSGTPVVTTDFGAFTETVEQGVSGYRCHTLADFLEAVEACDTLDPSVIRHHALTRYSLEAVAPLYDAYLARLATLHGDGWYTT